MRMPFSTMKSDLLYIGIEDPSGVRRSLLESSKDIIQFLQRFEKLKSIRAEKYAQMAKLKVIYDDIISTFPEIKNELPKIDIKELPRMEQRKAIVNDTRLQPEQPSPKRATAVDRLEAELSEIESKLKSLQ